MSGNYYQTIHEIIKTGHWITERVNKTLKEFNITEPQFNVLRILRDANGEPLTVQKILEKMIQRNSNVTRIVDKLLSKGLVTRQENPNNRRKMDIGITKTGLRLLKKLDKNVENIHEPMMKRLSPEELEQLKELIYKLIAEKKN